MKLAPLLFVASLLANAVFIARPFIPAARPSVPTTTSGHSGAPSDHTASGAKADFIAALKSDDLTALRDVLRAAGFSDDIVRNIVQARLWKKYEPRFKALNKENEPSPNQAWWKNDPRDEERDYLRADQAESQSLQSEMDEETKRLLGPDPNEHTWHDPRLAFLSESKRKTLQKIEQDYGELISGVDRDTKGFPLPSDTQKLRLLEEEKMRDIEALMTPEERHAYELRLSPTAQNLIYQMTRFDATEEEYLKIFTLQKAFDEKYNPDNGRAYDPFASTNYDEKLYEERDKAEKQLQAQIRALIGETRYAESIKKEDHDYQQLQAAARRLDLPPDTPDRLYALRDINAASIQSITTNASLALEQKKKALAALAASTREQVRASLGYEAADAYFQTNGMVWLKALEQGDPVTFNKDRVGWEAHPLEENPPPNDTALAPVIRVE